MTIAHPEIPAWATRDMTRYFRQMHNRLGVDPQGVSDAELMALCEWLRRFGCSPHTAQVVAGHNHSLEIERAVAEVRRRQGLSLGTHSCPSRRPCPFEEQP